MLRRFAEGGGGCAEVVEVVLKVLRGCAEVVEVVLKVLRGCAEGV